MSGRRVTYDTRGQEAPDRLTEELLAKGTATAVGPSAELRTRLQQLGVSDRAWKKAARRHLRQIAGDLPLFDSTWIDACVCERLLTPWQADVLNGPHPDALLMGPAVLEAVAEVTPYGPILRGRHTESGQPIEVLQLTAPSVEQRKIHTALDQIVAQHQQAPAAIYWPRMVSVESDDQLTIAFSEAPGMRLRDWIVRRGRMTSELVASIATQLLDAVNQLERSGRCHGDIRAETVRVAPDGRIALTQAGVRLSIEPAVHYRSDQSPEAYVGIAPERIGTNQPATAASERYAVGCLLWEMLTGRPATPHGSALGCLRAHLEHDLPNLEDFAPNTSTALADLVRGLLAVDPETRPRDFHTDVARVKRMPALAVPKRRTRHSRGALNSQRARNSQRPRSVIATLAASIVFAAAAWFTVPALLSENETQSVAEAASPSVIGPVRLEASAANSDTDTTVALQPTIPTIPERPDAKGRLDLGSGIFRATDLAWFGELTIVGAKDGSTRIQIDTPWSVHADSIRMENVALVGRGAIDTLLDLHTQESTFVNCRIDAKNAVTALRWTALDNTDATGRKLNFSQCRIDGSVHGVALASDCVEIDWTDTLITSQGTALTFKRWPRSPARLRLNHSTLRGLNALIGVRDETIDLGQPMLISIESSIVEAAGLGMFDVPAVSAESVVERVSIEGRQSVVHGDTPWPLFAAGPQTPLNYGRLEFAGPAQGDDSASRLITADIPLPPDNWPGIRVAPTVARVAATRPRENTETTQTAAQTDAVERANESFDAGAEIR